MKPCEHCGGTADKFATYKNVNRLVQRFRCRDCSKTFSEKQPLDTIRIEHAKVVQIVKLLTEGMGIRAVARFSDCNIRTVLHVLETVGKKCHEFHDRTVRHIETGSLQLDELWSRVGCSQKTANRQKYGDDRGDQYTYLALTA